MRKPLARAWWLDSLTFRAAQRSHRAMQRDQRAGVALAWALFLVMLGGVVWAAIITLGGP